MPPPAPRVERRLFQIVVLIACAVPITAGAAGAWLGTRMIGRNLPSNADLESHFHYLSGLLLGIGIMFAATVPNIDQRAGLFKVLGTIVIIGGLARLIGTVRAGGVSTPDLLALVMELLVVPALMLWFGRIERRTLADR